MSMPRSVLGDFIAAQSAVLAGDMSGATNAMRLAVSNVDWSTRKPQQVYCGWSVYTHKGMSYGWVWVDSAARRLVSSDSTMDTLGCFGPAMTQFLDDMTSGASGLKHVTMDSGAYAQAARAEAQFRGVDTVRAKDAITDADEKVSALIAQATSMQGAAATDLQVHSFLQRYSDSQAEIAEIAERLVKLQGSLDIAGRLIAALG